MNDAQIKEFAEASVQIAARAAQAWLKANGKTANTEALATELKLAIRSAFGQAMADAKEALDCGMEAVASQTFAASMGLAGIEAAKAACTI